MKDIDFWGNYLTGVEQRKNGKEGKRMTQMRVNYGKGREGP